MVYKKVILDISSPDDARIYIKDLVKNEIPDATWVQLDSGKFIVFSTMTDKEAVIAARALHDLVIEAGKQAVKH